MSQVSGGVGPWEERQVNQGQRYHYVLDLDLTQYRKGLLMVRHPESQRHGECQYAGRCHRHGAVPVLELEHRNQHGAGITHHTRQSAYDI